MTPRLPAGRPCRNCGEPLPDVQPDSGKRAKFHCSQKCRDQYSYSRRPPRGKMPSQHKGSHVEVTAGTYVYRDDDPQYPNHLTRIKDGANKSTGDCKKCAQITGTRTPDQVLAAVRELQQRWAKSETWDGKPDIVSHAYAKQLAEALGIEETA